MLKSFMAIRGWMQDQSTSLRQQHGVVETILSQSTFHVALALFCAGTVSSATVCAVFDTGILCLSFLPCDASVQSVIHVLKSMEETLWKCVLHYLHAFGHAWCICSLPASFHPLPFPVRILLSFEKHVLRMLSMITNIGIGSIMELGSPIWH